MHLGNSVSLYSSRFTTLGMSALWMAKRTKKLEAFYFFGLTQHSSLCAECTHTQQHTVLGLEQETKNDGRTTNAHRRVYWSPCATQHCIGGGRYSVVEVVKPGLSFKMRSTVTIRKYVPPIKQNLFFNDAHDDED